MLDQEDYDGLERLFEMRSGRDEDLAEVERMVEEQLAEARADFAGWSARNARNTKRRFGHRVVKFILNHHPAARGLSREDKDLIRRVAAGEDVSRVDPIVVRGADGTVGISPENAKKWHDRIQRWLPVLKIIATFTPVPYNFAVVGVIVVLVIIDENRLKPYIVEQVFVVYARAA